MPLRQAWGAGICLRAVGWGELRLEISIEEPEVEP